MGLTRQDLIGDMSDSERASRQAWIDRTSSNDQWANKIFKKVGILITGHQSNRPYMKACVESHAKLGYWITMAYDNYANPGWDNINHNEYMPGKETLDLIDMFLIPHHQVWGGCMYPWFWLMKWGVSAMQDFEYIYCVNSDFVLEKPENFDKLFELLGDADYMSYGPNTETTESTCFIAKTSALKKIMQHFQDHFIPWDEYEKYTQEFGNAEARFARAIKDLGLKKVVVEPGICAGHTPCEQLHQYGHGTWYDIVGFRHIHGEHNYAYRNRTLPPHYKYLDPRFMGDEYNRIKEYWDTQDIKVLENWWAKD